MLAKKIEESNNNKSEQVLAHYMCVYIYVCVSVCVIGVG